MNEWVSSAVLTLNGLASHLPTYPLARSLAHSLTHSLTYKLTNLGVGEAKSESVVMSEKCSKSLGEWASKVIFNKGESWSELVRE